MKLRINNTEVEEQRCIKYLGVYLDRKLNFSRHTEETRRKAYGAKKILNPYLRKNNPLTRALKIQLYRAYVRSILTFSSPVWASAAKCHLNKLQVVENYCLRQILGKSSREITNNELYRLTKLMPVTERIKATARKFFETTTKRFNITTNIGSINAQNAHFRVKHKLINSI